MVALVTGASSGLGKDMSFELAARGYDLIITARSKDKLEKLKKEIEKEFKVKVEVIICDVSDKKEVTKLHDQVFEKYGTIDVLINNAGFGTCGFFDETDLDFEVSMIETNVVGLHILTKLFLRDMMKENKGHIMNVASIAGYMTGPLMATYYATKNYVVRLTQAIDYELKKKKSKVKLCLLCPGPVETNFNKVANVSFGFKGDNSKRVAKKAIKGMLKNKKVIFSSWPIKVLSILAKFATRRMCEMGCYTIQKSKIEK